MSIAGSAPRLTPVTRPAVVLLLLALWIFVARWHTRNEPSDRDTAAYAVIAHELLCGKRLYEGVLLDQKPPAIHATYALAELVAGYGRAQIFVLNLGAAFATLAGVYFLGRTVAGTQAAALWLAAFWAICSGHLWLEANQPNTEVFINAFTVWGMALWFRQPPARGRLATVVLAGGCFALASLYKHVAVLVPVALGLACLAFRPDGRPRSAILRELLVVAAVGAAAWGAVFGWFALTGRGAAFLECLFGYNLHYAGDQRTNLRYALFGYALFPPPLHGLSAWFLLIGGGWALLLARGGWRWCAVLAMVAAGTHLAVVLPGKFFAHYYQLWVGFLVLGGAVVLGAFERWAGHERVLRLAAPVCLGALLAVQLPYYARSAEEWSAMKYADAGCPFVTTSRLARFLKERMLPGEVFFQLGAQTQMFFDLQQRPVSILCDYGVFDGPFAERLGGRVLGDLQAAQPDVIVVEHVTIWELGQRKHPLLPWLEAHYDMAPVYADWAPCYLTLRKGSPIEQRFRQWAACRTAQAAPVAGKSDCRHSARPVQSTP